MNQSTRVEATMGIVRIHSSMSLDGYICGPNDWMDWVFDHAELTEHVEGLRVLDGPATRAVIDATGAVLSGRGCYDFGRDATEVPPETGELFGGAWSGPAFVATHRPPAGDNHGVTFVSGDINDIVNECLKAANGKDLLVLGANIASQCLEANLVDEVLLHQVPILLGGGVNLFENRSGPIELDIVEVRPQRRSTTIRLRPRHR
ncbi:dihydrofolate reductase family protein [Natronoglycomyces albus]|uniref:Dihydrofolate reductase family protein n=1 Tax=Natronoglycomyces albus TaxID=2811108 RepID=A0A895XQH2_9ACTN|nr:dihydrofolate reductase family protein [Natronoglycomyces albus]QSB05619.1 dihydrofolate reductase family protein [Natronoglycomyces albus]